jgi:hypothetical protein
MDNRRVYNRTNRFKAFLKSSLIICILWVPSALYNIFQWRIFIALLCVFYYLLDDLQSPIVSVLCEIDCKLDINARGI